MYFLEKKAFILILLESPTTSKTDDEFAYDNALCNYGTIKVETITGKQIYPKLYMVTNDTTKKVQTQIK